MTTDTDLSYSKEYIKEFRAFSGNMFVKLPYVYTFHSGQTLSICYIYPDERIVMDWLESMGMDAKELVPVMAPKYTGMRRILASKKASLLECQETLGVLTRYDEMPSIPINEFYYCGQMLFSYDKQIKDELARSVFYLNCVFKDAYYRDYNQATVQVLNAYYIIILDRLKHNPLWRGSIAEFVNK